MTWFRVILAATGCLLSATPAFAQKGFADNGRVVIGAERLTGLFIEKISIEQTVTLDDGVGGTSTSKSEADASSTTFAFFGSSTGILGATSTTAGGTSMAPRLAADVFVASGFSLGGALTYVHSEGTTTLDSSGEENQPVFNGLVLAPRVGFAVPVSPSFALWPRAGVTHSIYWASQEDDDEDADGNSVTVKTTQTLSFTDLTLEGMLAVTPVPNVAIIFGPYLDLGLTGSLVTENTPDQNAGIEIDTDWKYTSYGVAGGIGVVF